MTLHETSAIAVSCVLLWLVAWSVADGLEHTVVAVEIVVLIAGTVLLVALT